MKFSCPLCVALLLALNANIAFAAGNPVISNSWIRESPDWVTILAAYAKIENNNSKEIELIKVSSPAFQRMELHSMSLEHGMMEMKKQDSVLIPAGASVNFEPGSNHFMCYSPQTSLPHGKKINVTFEFSNGIKVKTTMQVRNPRKEN